MYFPDPYNLPRVQVAVLDAGSAREALPRWYQKSLNALNFVGGPDELFSMAEAALRRAEAEIFEAEKSLITLLENMAPVADAFARQVIDEALELGEPRARGCLFHPTNGTYKALERHNVPPKKRTYPVPARYTKDTQYNLQFGLPFVRNTPLFETVIETLNLRYRDCGVVVQAAFYETDEDYSDSDHYVGLYISYPSGMKPRRTA